MTSTDKFKGFIRNLRHGGMSSAIGFLRSPEIRKILPSLCQSFPRKEFEIHLLSGASRIDMALWMAASWVATTERHWRFVVHDDGTLTPDLADLVYRTLSGSRVITSLESEAALAGALTGYPLALKCRNLHPLSRKLFDIPFFSSGSHFLTIDTDVLFFRRPDRLLDWVSEPGRTSLFLEDVADNSLPDAIEAARLLGGALTRRINTGIIAVSKETILLPQIEECLERTSILNGDPWFIEQSLYATLASLNSIVEFLPPSYEMSVAETCQDDAVSRHYVGAVRHLFYSEGIQKLRPLIAGRPHGLEP